MNPMTTNQTDLYALVEQAITDNEAMECLLHLLSPKINRMARYIKQPLDESIQSIHLGIIEHIRKP